jgi:hypothetical protein
MMLALGLSYTNFIVLRNIPSTPSFFSAFIMKVCWILSKAFFYIYWEDHVGFVLTSVYVLYYVYRFTYVESSLHPWNETNLVMVCDFFWRVVGFCLPVFYWESLHVYSLKILVYSSLFWLHLCLVLEWMQYWLPRMSLVVFPPFLFPGKAWDILVLVLL